MSQQLEVGRFLVVLFKVHVRNFLKQVSQQLEVDRFFVVLFTLHYILLNTKLSFIVNSGFI